MLCWNNQYRDRKCQKPYYESRFCRVFFFSFFFFYWKKKLYGTLGSKNMTFGKISNFMYAWSTFWRGQLSLIWVGAEICWQFMSGVGHPGYTRCLTSVLMTLHYSIWQDGSFNFLHSNGRHFQMSLAHCSFAITNFSQFCCVSLLNTATFCIKNN